ncbi:hypothetical protein [Nitratireductor sp. XY-223]|uniref:hypothetical protein n=1 Tax=Nitratireductor sp. XY-223 TaxID=2561926 RepID=UPI0010A9BC62|nr:hypothetical protein [Nitratireductor sp. XY-223]
MTCPCDRQGGETGRRIAAGLSVLPHPVNDFSQLRSSMLGSIRDFEALVAWNARSEDDLGVMLLEFLAYVGHNVEFYNWVAANESFLRTAIRESTVAGIVSLLGYSPRPASPAYAELAATASGQRTVTVPAGTQFLSGAFADEAPQLFENEADAHINERANSWTIAAPKRDTLGIGGGTYTEDYLDLEPFRADVEADDMILIRTGAGLRGTFTVTAVEDTAAADGTSVKRVIFDRPLNLPNATPVAQIDVLKPTQTANLFTVPFDPDGVLLLIFVPYPLPEYKDFTLDRVRSDLRPGEPVVVSLEDDHRWFNVAAVRNVQKTLVAAQTVEVTIDVDGTPTTSSSEIPATKTTVTRMTLDVDFNNPNRRLPGFNAYAPVNDLESYEIRYGFVRAGRVARPPVMEIWPTGPLALQPAADRRVVMPPEPEAPRRYVLADEFGLAYAVTGSLDAAAGRFVFEEAETWPEPLTPPVTLHGNVFGVRRGETIRGEVIGSGNAALPGQEFKLGKAPVAFLADTTGATERGYSSTVSLRVDGILWEEVEDLVTAGPQDSAFMLRQNAEQETLVVTGDGEFGRRAPTGSSLSVDYVHGAGAAAPPADAINQIATSVEGLSAVVNPVEASGGADGEKPEDVKRNGPSVAMLLGRIVSLDDVLAVARAFPGVIAARAGWIWHDTLQTAAIQVWCIAAEAVVESLQIKIRNLSEPGLSVSVEAAEPVALRLAMDVEIDPRYQPADVEAALRLHLTDPRSGLLHESRIGIGEPLFRSRIFAETLRVEGVVAVPALLHDGNAFNQTGLTPGAGRYFDVAAGGLVINGKEDGNGE